MPVCYLAINMSRTLANIIDLIAVLFQGPAHPDAPETASRENDAVLHCCFNQLTPK